MSEGRGFFEDWRLYYNTERLHRLLGLLMPAQFAKNRGV